MRDRRWMAAVLLFAGCQPAAAPTPAADPPIKITTPTPKLPEPATFASWPKVTDKPVHVGPSLWTLCRAPESGEVQKREAEAAFHGPHVGSIVVRVSPESLEAFRAGKPLPEGASVIKEKYKNGSEKMSEYAVMVKRQQGYDRAGGDWEFAYVTLGPDGKESRGQMSHCVNCHAAAKATDYLFRSYHGESTNADPIADFLAYLKKNGIELEPIPDYSGFWKVAGRPKDQHFDVVIALKSFRADMTPTQMQKELMPISLAFLLNAPGRLAMSHPSLRGLPDDRNNTKWPDSKSLPISKELLRLFKAYTGQKESKS